MRQTAVEGVVAAILNSEELVINRGTYHGVKMGARFAVLSQEPLAIVDPETGEKIDELDREKIRVEAVQVRERTATCSTIMPSSSLLSVTAAMPDLFPKKPSFKSNQYPEDLEPEESYIKIGDRVRELRKPLVSSRMIVADRDESVGAPPTKDDFDRLDRVHSILVEEGLKPPKGEFTFDFLAKSVYEKGFDYVVTFDARKGYSAEVRRLGENSEPANSEGYWDQESALAFALHRALRW